MKESEEKVKNVKEQKSKIRERYKGVGADSLDVIPALPQEDFYNPETVKRVAVYARVSTDDPRQTSSYELQRNHYNDMVSGRPDWQLVQIYADEGISGTSLQHRDAFIQMIHDCQEGKIDLIVTKSVYDRYSGLKKELDFFVGAIRSLGGKKSEVLLALVVEGLTWDQISDQYDICKKTITNYRKTAIKDIDALYEKRKSTELTFILS